MSSFVLAAAALCVLAAALSTRTLWWRGPDAPRPSVAVAAGLAAFMLATAGGGYALLGAPDRLALGPESSAQAARQAPAPSDQAALRAQAIAQIDAVVQQLTARLEARPDDAEGWQLLARTHAMVGRHAPAVEAFRKAEPLRPNDADLLSEYALSLAMTRERRLDGEPVQLIERALKLDPKHPKALALAGTAAFERKDYRGAVRYWERLAALEPAETPFGQQIRGSLTQARQLAGLPAPADDPVAAASRPSAAAQVSGTVTLAEGLKGRASPEDTVFVFARAAEGGRMPLAILRKQVKDLPFQFTLDDSMAMSPAARLSGTASVVVGARISRSGNAMPQSGDLEGLAPASPVGTAGLKVEIDAEVKR